MNIYGIVFEYLEHQGTGVAWCTEPQCHSSHEMLVLNSGSMTVRAGGNRLAASAGDVLLIPAGVVHDELSPSSDPADCHRLMFALPGLAHETFARVRDEDGAIRQLIRLMFADNAEGLLHDIKQNCLAQAAVAQFLHLHAAWHEGDLVMSVRGYIHAHIGEHITLEDLARHMQVTKSHFVRTYRSLTGRTPMDDLRLARLEHACQLLHNSSLSVKEIAGEVGLPSQQKLARLFQEEIGMTPTFYRSCPRLKSVPPVFGCDGENGPVVFARREDGSYATLLRRRGGAWNGWADTGMRGRRVRTITNARGRLEAFLLADDGSVWHGVRPQGGAGWTQWSSMDVDATQIDAARNTDGRLELFAVVPGGSVCNRFETAPGKAWSTWCNIGGMVSEITVAMNEDGRLEVFGIDEDNALTHKWRTNAWIEWNGRMPPLPQAPEMSKSCAEWYGWISMGRVARQIALANNPDGRLEIFAVTMTHGVCHCWQVVPNSPWSGWANMGGMVLELAAVPGADGNINLFAIGRNREILHNRKTTDWTGWQSMGAAAMHIAVGRHTDGRLELFAITPERTLGHICQVTPDGAWGEWSTIASPPLESF